MCTKNALPRKVNKPEGESVETTTVVQVVMDETWKYEDDDYVFVFGSEVSADVQRRETHSCTGGASPSACRFRHVSEWTTRGSALPLSSIDVSSIELRG